MRIIQMDPAERRLPVPLAEPCRGSVNDETSIAASVFGTDRICRSDDSVNVVQIVVINIETAIESELAVEYERGDECAGVVSLVREYFRQSGDVDAEPFTAVATNPGLGRIQPGQQTCMGRQGQRGNGAGAFAQDSGPCQGVENRRATSLIAIAPDPIGPRRIERDQQNVGA